MSIATGSDVAVTGTALYGIDATSTGTGSMSVTTGANTNVTSGSAGIFVINQAAAIPQADASQITVTATGTINSGTTNETTGNAPAGISVGYAGTNLTPNLNIFGSIDIQDAANITAAAGYGIKAADFGNGSIVVDELLGTTITGLSGGILAQQLSDGSGDVSINIASGATVSGQTGITGVVTGSGTLTITNYGTVIGTSATGAGISATGVGSFTINNYGAITSATGSATTGSVASGGTAFINDYGTMTSAANQTVGGSTGRTATLTVSGATAQFNVTGSSSGMTVGNTGVGYMYVEGGGTFASSFLTIAAGVGGQGTVIVEGTGTSLNTTSGANHDIVVGNYGNATLTVESGANVASGSIDIAAQVGSTGTVTFEGAGTTVTASSLNFGSGSATLTISDGATVDFTGAVTGTGGLTVAEATLQLGNAVASSVTVTLDGSDTISLSDTTAFAATIKNFGVGDTLRLTDLPYASGNKVVWTQNGSSGTLAIDDSGGTLLESITLAGTYNSTDFVLVPDSSSGTDLEFNSQYYWGSFAPLQPTSDVHLAGGGVEFNSTVDVLGVTYNSIPNYNSASSGPYSVTRSVLPLDPFLLPTVGGNQVAVSAASLTLPAKSHLILPNVVSGAGVSAEGIDFYVAQPSGSDVIDQIIITGNQDDLNFSTSTTIESANTTNTIFSVDGSFRQDNSTSSGTPYLSTYALSWDQYATAAYSIDFQIFTASGSASSSVETPLSISSFNGATVSAAGGTNNATNLPAWEFRNGGGIYTLAMAQSSGSTDIVDLTGYTLNGALISTRQSLVRSPAPPSPSAPSRPAPLPPGKRSPGLALRRTRRSPTS